MHMRFSEYSPHHQLTHSSEIQPHQKTADSLHPLIQFSFTVDAQRGTNVQKTNNTPHATTIAQTATRTQQLHWSGEREAMDPNTEFEIDTMILDYICTKAIFETVTKRAEELAGRRPIEESNILTLFDSASLLFPLLLPYIKLTRNHSMENPLVDKTCAEGDPTRFARQVAVDHRRGFVCLSVSQV